MPTLRNPTSAWRRFIAVAARHLIPLGTGIFALAVVGRVVVAAPLLRRAGGGLAPRLQRLLADRARHHRCTASHGARGQLEVPRRELLLTALALFVVTGIRTGGVL